MFKIIIFIIGILLSMNVTNAEIVYVSYEDINTEDNINNLKDIKTGEEQEINQENILEEQPINNSQKILKNNNNSDTTISSSSSTPHTTYSKLFTKNKI